MQNARVAADSLHVRSSPRVADNVVGFLHKGDVVEVRGTSADSRFARIRHGGTVGWASTKWLRKASSAGSYVVTAEESLWVRKGPDKAAPTIDALHRGDVVRVDRTSPDGRWHHVSKGPLKGWASARYLRRGGASSSPAVRPGTRQANWLAIAQHELTHQDTTRLGSAGDNRRILMYLRSVRGLGPGDMHDETFWCSTFVNWCVEKAGVDGTDSAWARSWLGWGRRIATPTKGCIVVFKRGSGGHVGFYLGGREGAVKVLGGNQGNRVSITSDARTVLGYRTL
jgi:uncharacterized protein (TIGR02594 family)